MIRYTSLKSLPVGTDFPEDLRCRIVHDAAKGRLGFEGFMCKADFDRLYSLSVDRDYRNAIEELFRICTFDADETPQTPLRRALAYVLGLLMTGVAMTAATAAWLLARTG
jgi:hypothetical protein